MVGWHRLGAAQDHAPWRRAPVADAQDAPDHLCLRDQPEVPAIAGDPDVIAQDKHRVRGDTEDARSAGRMLPAAEGIDQGRIALRVDQNRGRFWSHEHADQIPPDGVDPLDACVLLRPEDDHVAPSDRVALIVASLDQEEAPVPQGRVHGVTADDAQAERTPSPDAAQTDQKREQRDQACSQRVAPLAEEPVPECRATKGTSSRQTQNPHPEHPPRTK